MESNTGLKITFSLGLDVGSTTISHALLDPDDRLFTSGTVFHRGDIHTCLHEVLRGLPIDQIRTIGVNEKGHEFIRHGIRCNEQVSLIRGSQRFAPGVRSILHIGAEKFGLILLDRDGNYLKYISNTGCAAGTGSFLDQQARRLGLDSSAHLSEQAEKCTGEPPLIATRCSVFAKTDLIHAQQRGHSLQAICSGLCRGVARTIIDTVVGADPITEPLIITGGVSLNHSVCAYILEFLRISPLHLKIPDRILAVGAALLARESGEIPVQVESAGQLIKDKPPDRKYHYPPLTRIPHRQPDAADHPAIIIDDVETERFVKRTPESTVPVFLGIDIGSTSTKAVLMDRYKTVHAGLYTRTQGQPILAVQKILRAIRQIEKSELIRYPFIAAGTTGSGRKFMHHVLGTDRAYDEISAHARAACQLNPKVDTIIEIGGQDSKFTVLKNGRVVFSIMNTVCAAGTGSFLEEQARKLNMPLEAYSDVAEKMRAPLTTDRCTVFMERDLNQLLSLGYAGEELLAAALHSVRDNYLTKVAHTHKIGNTIAFQGATGKNKALVKAFEYSLGKPIFVTRFCHLTGAMGVCLLLLDQDIRLGPQFRHGFEEERIEASEEVCRDCPNHCKIAVIHIKDNVIRWGHLCGRKGDDMRVPLRTSRIRMLADRERMFKDTGTASTVKRFKGPAIGIPDTLYFMDTLHLWSRLFLNLGIRVLQSRSDSSSILTGKSLMGAEFCTPIALLHGHVERLLNRSDFCFLPVIFNNGSKKNPKTYCYYSNYAVSLIRNNPHLNAGDKVISPVFKPFVPLDSQFQALWNSLPAPIKDMRSKDEFREAFSEAVEWFRDRNDRLRRETAETIHNLTDMGIVLLGRPYLILDEQMNNRIPHRLSEMGYPILYQDMLPIDGDGSQQDSSYVHWNHWIYGDRILRAAEKISEFKGLFPIYITAFKCAPDAFIVPYFRNIMDRYDKPYLVLQLDEHQSIEGYDTRLEAAVETFKNYQGMRPGIHPVTITVAHALEQKTYLLPNYDPLSMRLVAAAFRKYGYQAIPLEETEETVKTSIHLNDGQCLPVSAIAQAVAHTIESHNLEPEKSAVLANALSLLSCGLPQYPVYLKELLRRLGQGLDKVEILATDPQMMELPKRMLIDIYTAYLIGGLVHKMACRVRPREVKAGNTDVVVGRSIETLEQTVENGGSLESAFETVVRRFIRIPKDPNRQRLPQIGIVGDLYVRDNHVFNQNLIREIERAGAEAIPTPYTFLVRLLADPHFRNLLEEKKFAVLVIEKTLLSYVRRFDKSFFGMAESVLQETLPRFTTDLKPIFEKYHLTYRHGGETSQNLLKILHLIDHYPNLRLIVHVNPIFCCPALVSESLFRKLERDTGIPIVSITYDGTGTQHNQILSPYLYFIDARNDNRKDVKMNQPP